MTPQRRTTWLGAGALLLLVVAAYWPVRHGGFLWDDATTLLGLPAMRHSGGWREFWLGEGFDDYWPLHYSLLWAEWQLWGPDTLGYHLVSILLHGAATLGLWGALRRGTALTPGVAWAAAALFAVHPVNAEAVAWIVQQKTLQSAAYFFASLYAFIRYQQGGPRAWYAAALLAFSASLLAKAASLPLPVVLFGYLCWRSPSRRSGWLALLPFVALAAFFGLLGLWFHQQHPVYAGGIRDDDLNSRILTAARALWFYLSKALAPHGLAFIYPRWAVGSQSWSAAAPFLAWLGVAATLGALARRRLMARASLWALAYFAAVLLPCLGLVDISFMKFSLVADHWQYMALAGPLALAALGANRGLDALGRRASPAFRLTLKLSLVAAVLVGLLASTWQHLALFQSEEALWLGTLQTNPDAFIAHNNLGQTLLSKRQFSAAAAHFATAAKLAPLDSEGPLLNEAEAFHRAGDEAAALASLGTAAQRFPASALAHAYFGLALQRTQHAAAAAAELRAALALDPNLAAAHQGLALVASSAGDQQEALKEQQTAARLAPLDADILSNLGALLLRSGAAGTAEAIAALSKAVELAPESATAYADLGFALMQDKHLGEAEAALRKALSLDANLPQAEQNLGYLRALNQDLSGAIEHYRTAARLAPNSADVHLTLGLLLAKAGQTTAARAELNTAKGLAPLDAEIARAWAALPP